MDTFPRPNLKSLSAAALAGSLLLVPRLFAEHGSAAPAAGPEQHVTVFTDDPALLNHPSSQGYLGVGLRDLDTERAAQLRLPDPRGAEIINVDHDAPAAKAGLRIHDVILSMNGQVIEGEAQLSRMLRNTPPGHTVTFIISRNGQQQSLSVELADRSTIEADAWSQHIPVPDPADSLSLPAPAFGNGFISGLAVNPLYTGLDLDMLGPQLAGYFGVQDGLGLLVRRVDDSSPAAAAGLRAGDVITKVNGKAIATTSQWLHTIHANRGRQIELTVIRDHKENTVTMMAGRSKKSGRLTWPGFDTPQRALAGPASAQVWEVSDSGSAAPPQGVPDFR